jgi:hypothetical protein
MRWYTVLQGQRQTETESDSQDTESAPRGCTHFVMAVSRCFKQTTVSFDGPEMIFATHD